MTEDGAVRVDRCDVAVLGGGIAGLMAAAAQAPNEQVVLLEQADRVGGRVESVHRGDYWVNLGAQFTEGEGPLIAQMDRLGVQRGSLAGKSGAMAWNGHVAAIKRPAESVFKAHLPLRARIDLALLGMRLLRDYHRATKRRDARSAELRSRLDSESAMVLAASIRTSEVRTIFRCLIRNWMGCEPEETAATQALLSLGSNFAKSAELPNFSLPVGGNQALVDRLASELGSRVRLHSQVRNVTWNESEVRIRYDGPDGPATLIASRCVVALPADRALKVLSDLDAERREALGKVKYGTFLVAGVFTDEQGPQPWDDLFMISTPGLSFEVVFNHASAARGAGPRKPGGALVCYAGGDQARSLWTWSDADVADTFRRDLCQLFPALEGHIADVVIRRQPRSVPYWAPGDRSAMRLLREPSGPVTFAGDYLAALPSMAGAAATGERTGSSQPSR